MYVQSAGEPLHDQHDQVHCILYDSDNHNIWVSGDNSIILLFWKIFIYIIMKILSYYLDCQTELLLQTGSILYIYLIPQSVNVLKIFQILAVKNICSIMMTFPYISSDISRELNIS